MSPRFISSWSAALALAAVAGPAAAQVVIPDDLNQIEGTVAFTNPLGAFATPLSRVDVSSVAQNLPVTRTASTVGTVNGNQAGYSLTALASGVTHEVKVDADFGNDWYKFENKISPAVPSEPAPGVALNFAECAGFVSVEFVDIQGNPVQVPSMTVSATPELETSAQAGTSAGTTSREEFAVRGDGRSYLIHGTYKSGDFTYPFEETRVVDCNVAAEPVRIVFIEDDPPYEPGAITGYVDLRFLNEIPNTTMYAVHGPLNEDGSVTIGGMPASGPFAITDLMPSDFYNLDTPYKVYGNMSFDTGFGIETFNTPRMEVFVPDGQTVPTNNSFIMDAGYVTGVIDVRGPRQVLDHSSENLRILSGPSSGGANVNVPLEVNQVLAGLYSMSGDYRMGVGAPGNTTEDWRPTYQAKFQNSVTQAADYLKARFTHKNLLQQSVTVAPNSTVNPVNVGVCVSQVRADVVVNSTNPGGTSFTDPVVTFSGSYLDDDAGVSYSVTDGRGEGLPGGTPAQFGIVNLVVPQGRMNFDATVTSYDEDSVPSTTQLRPVTHDIGCGAIINPLVVTPETNPICYGETTAHDTVSAHGFLYPTHVQEMYAVINCDESDMPAGADFDVTLCPADKRIPICGGALGGDCGVDPTDVPFDVSGAGLPMCGQTLQVVAIDDTGSVSVSESKPFAVETERPVGAGCTDVSSVYSSTLGGGVIDIEHITEPLNSCGLPVEGAQCFFDNGTDWIEFSTNDLEDAGKTTLSGGQWYGYCLLDTACGPRDCGFTATVTQ